MDTFVAMELEMISKRFSSSSWITCGKGLCRTWEQRATRKISGIGATTDSYGIQHETSRRRSQLTKLVSTEEYGVVLSIVGLVGNIGMLVMAVGSNGLFVATVEVYTGFSLLLTASTNLVAIGILLYIVCAKKRDESRHDGYTEVLSNQCEKMNNKHW